MKIKGVVLAGAVLLANPVWASSPAAIAPTSVDQAVAMVEKENVNGSAAIAALEPFAQEGEGAALLWLGRIYRDGIGGTPKDPKRAFGLFERAAGKEGKNIDAKYELASAYYNGEGTDRNLIGAYIWATLSLQTPSSTDKKAQALTKTLSGLLSKEQLTSAETIAKQIHTLYLD